MANGALTTGAVTGGTLGLSFGPIGAAVGAGAGWIASGGYKNIFGSKKKKMPVPVKLPWYENRTIELLGLAIAITVVVVLIRRK